ncbi:MULTISPECIES: iron uptake transporter deferrochelatase/peroxidase subunit [unclassified Bosea (in: a-proteobacteria)]|uniref:iron uptake transporter deferrochelatase/peroxidase subunit n=1 Tax=unclassified Bosea (in: a-proteobacteria) TaxID=2653178 RepID=UPI000954FE90|nr:MULTISPECIES: iron uptake transporter deferrochelatase/peroxidase subunit [unclassified Bosea (in: a-proteobacteria)]TAJ27088.1 MAG: deferrochelatase/peroxidase EfeB [Bosea sp. (in: a-proteobacteria)]SIR30063.1 deferrochelatase/peroxidase EfeB [Bosea sp. TND4EK4]
MRKPDSPLSPSRRALLAGGAAALGSAGWAHAAGEPASNPAAAPTSDAAAQSQPFHGLHQPGIVTPRPATGLVAAFDVVATSLDELERLFHILTERIAFLMAGGPAPTAPSAFPPPDSGILGPVIAPDNLTVTVALGASLFDDRYGLSSLKPQHLQRMKRFSNDALDAGLCHGDLLLQICSNGADTNIHALRDILKNTPDLLLLRWKQEGSVPVRQPKPAEPTSADDRPSEPPESARNLLGFRDGTANPDGTDAAAMERLVWVRAGTGEPGWAVHGTYQVVRIIRNFVERWDRTALGEQEEIIGRRKDSGAPFGGLREYDEPVYADDPDGKRTKLDAHIRLANPRRADTEPSRMLRRPFNYSNGVTRAGQLDMGLLFICFQQDLERSFIAVQTRLNGEPLEEYIKPVGGGYFFVLPGVPDGASHLGAGLIQAARDVAPAQAANGAKAMSAPKIPASRTGD